MAMASQPGETEKLWRAFRAGFDSSDEGYNGMVCAHRDPDVHLPKQFAYWLRTGEPADAFLSAEELEGPSGSRSSP